MKNRKIKNDNIRSRSGKRSAETGDAISDRNNNLAPSDELSENQSIERASNERRGDAAMNNQRVSKKRSGRSMDA